MSCKTSSICIQGKKETRDMSSELNSGTADDKQQLYLTITILDIIHGPVFYLKHNVSETGLFRRNLIGWSQWIELVFLRKTE
jgi:hypothetical protein